MQAIVYQVVNIMGGYGSDYDTSTDADVVKKSAASYNIDAGRKYEGNKKALPPPVGKILITKAKLPLVVAVDVTGSMKTYPQMIFEKLCILYNEILLFLPTALRDTFEISFCATGDATCDQYPLQVTDFAKGRELDHNIQSLFPEGGGGGQCCETYELVAYYYARRCEMPSAMKDPRPIFVFIGDEGYYPTLPASGIFGLIGDKIDADVQSATIFEELKKKFDTYILRVKYGASDEEKINTIWQEALGKDHVAIMEDPRRVVDIIIGIVAHAVKQFSLYDDRLFTRQTPEQVKQVHAALKILGIEGAAATTVSMDVKIGTDVKVGKDGEGEGYFCTKCKKMHARGKLFEMHKEFAKKKRNA